MSANTATRPCVSPVSERATASDDHDETLQAIGRGETEALERLYRELGPAVFSLAAAIVRDRGLAEDVLHDAFLRIWRGARSYQPGTSARAWVLTVARNVARDAVRHRLEPLLEAGADG